MQVTCPYCGSRRTTTKNHGRKTGSLVGTVAALFLTGLPGSVHLKPPSPRSCHEHPVINMSLLRRTSYTGQPTLDYHLLPALSGA